MSEPETESKMWVEVIQARASRLLRMWRASRGERVGIAMEPWWKRQLRALNWTGSARCAGCGKATTHSGLYRCYYCKLWMCEPCCAEHFGDDREGYFAERVDLDVPSELRKLAEDDGWNKDDE